METSQETCEQKPFFQLNNAICCVCLTEENLNLLYENSILNNLFIQLTKTQAQHEEKSPRNICTTCLQQLEVISQFICSIQDKWASQQEYILDDLCCKVCFVPETLVVFPQYLLDVFQSIIDIQVKPDFNRPENICNECLNKLEEISTFIDIIRHNDESLEHAMTIKQEPLAKIKEEHSESIFKDEYLEKKDEKQEILAMGVKQEPIDDEDDEFVETATKVSLKTEPNVFSYEIEANNNFIVKTEELSNEFEDTEGNINVEDWEDQKALLKLEIEDEGLQYDYKENIPIDCTTCNRSFDTTRGLLNHLKQRFRCRFKTSFVAQSWKSFLKKVAKPFKCQVCLKYFCTVQQKAEHTKAHFGKSCVICLFCGKPFVRQKEYLRHFRQHTTKQLPVKCKICPRKFPSKIVYLKHLTKHKKRSSNKKKYRCKICHLSNSRKSWLREHMKKEKVPCPYCPKKYCRTGQLASHLRSHTGERPFQCAVCSVRFSHKGNLIKHSRIHTGYRPHLCKICLKSFSRPDYLTKHYSCIHQKVYDSRRKTYKNQKKNTAGQSTKKIQTVYCNVCYKGYPSKSSLSSHLRVHNRGKHFQCTVCDKSFSYKGLLTGHMKIHLDYRPFACTLCPKRFIKRNDLTRHTFTHTKEKNFRCEICYEKFSRKDVLRLHLRNHTGQRPYQCENCLKAFTQKSNLTHHTKRCKMIMEVDVVD